MDLLIIKLLMQSDNYIRQQKSDVASMKKNDLTHFNTKFCLEYRNYVFYVYFTGARYFLHENH